MVSELRIVNILWSCDFSASNILLISVSGIIIALLNQFFHNNQSAYHLFDILSNWKILFQLSSQIYDSLPLRLLNSKTWWLLLNFKASNILLISVSGIIIALLNQFFHNNQSVYHLFDILSNWKILLQLSFQICDSLPLCLLNSKNGDYFLTSKFSISYYLFTSYGFNSCNSQVGWHKLSHMEFSDANSTWESWYFRICWWI